MISFSSTTKNELSRIMPEDRCCQLAELSAIIRMSGVVRFRGSEDVSLRMITENAAIARKIFSLLKNLYSLNVDIMIRKNKNLKKNNSYILEVRSDMGAREVLAESGVIVIDQNQMLTIDYGIPEHLVATRCCKRAYLRGAFLGGGSVSDPERAYHLEFVTHSEQHATDLKNMINSFGLGSKIVERKNVYVVYLKEGEQVVDILNIIGAHSALLRFENTRVYKQVRNNVNRMVNCETANLTKTINAAIKQVENIEFIRDTIGLEKLAPSLREIARLRLEFKDASLKELGQMLSPPLGKSGINHRLRKIEEIAERIKASGRKA